MGTVSYRKFIRWLPNAASEPTSTIVLTSRENRFVDVRVSVDSEGSIASPDNSDLPLSRLDWAIAGTVSSTTGSDGVRVAKFAHWINSRSVDADGFVDEGAMHEQADGTTLETGSMVNPDTDRDTPYEELWLDTELDEVKSKDACFVAKHEQGAHRGMVVRMGDFCQGVARRGEEVVAERWEKKEGQWTRTVRIGSGSLVCAELLKGAIKAAKGASFTSGGETWAFVEAY